MISALIANRRLRAAVGERPPYISPSVRTKLAVPVESIPLLDTEENIGECETFEFKTTPILKMYSLYDAFPALDIVQESL